jgi:hypothetical protein
MKTTKSPARAAPDNAQPAGGLPSSASTPPAVDPRNRDNARGREREQR